MREHGIETFEWPPNSPDLNLMENAWAWMSKHVYAPGRRPRTIPELIAAIRRAWDDLTMQVLNGLLQSMPERIRNLHRAKGGPLLEGKAKQRLRR